MMSGNIRRLKVIAEGLGDLCKEVVFVGGSIAELYADDPAATDIRPTMDVDCVIELTSYRTLQNFERLLRDRKFVNDIESDVICRWKYKDEIVDIMPDKDSILGFTNKWYRQGFIHREEICIDDALYIYILPPLYYLATKIEALRGRGGEDVRFSHDFEDLVYVLNNRQNITKLFDEEKDSDLLEYLSSWAKEMLLRQNCREEIECMLPYGDYDRVAYIIEILNHFSKMQSIESIREPSISVSSRREETAGGSRRQKTEKEEMNADILKTTDIRAALIDMDGVLYDSMPYHAHAWVRMLAEEGITAPYEEFFALEGMTGAAVIDMVMRREKGRPATDEEVRRWYRRKTELFVAQGRKQVMVGAPDVLAALVARKILCVLVTGSGQESLIESIERDFPGAFSRDRMVTANDVTHGKPHPEPYLRGIEKARLALPGLSQTGVIVIENAPLGVQAAKAAGLFTVGVATGPLPQTMLTDAGADITFPSMTALAQALE